MSMYSGSLPNHYVVQGPVPTAEAADAAGENRTGPIMKTAYKKKTYRPGPLSP